MSDHLTAEISVNVGEVPNSPGLKVAVRLALGPNHSGAIKTTFREKSGNELEDASVYLVVSAKNAEGAENLRELIQRVIDKAMTEEGLEHLPRDLREMIAKSDTEDFDGAPKFTFAVTVHDTHVVVVARPISLLRENIVEKYELVQGIAGEALLKEQELYFEFDAGRSVEELVNSQNAILDAFEAISLKLWLHLHPQIFGDLMGIASNMGAPENLTTGLGSLGLFSNATFAFNFKSSSELPEDIKESLGRLSTKANNFKELHQNIPPPVKSFFKHFADHGTGNLHIYAGLQTNAIAVDLHIPGVSKFIAE